MRDPSGDHAGVDDAMMRRDICRGVRVAMSTTNTSSAQKSAAFEMYAMRRESGDHAGAHRRSSIA